MKKTESQLTAPLRRAAQDARTELRDREAAVTTLEDRLAATRDRIRTTEAELQRMNLDRESAAGRLASGEITDAEFDQILEADAPLAARHQGLKRGAELLATEIDNAKRRVSDARGEVKRADGKLAMVMADAIVAGFRDDYQRAAGLLAIANRSAGQHMPATDGIVRHIGALRDQDINDLAQAMLAAELER